MSYIHIKNGRGGPLNNSLTVRELIVTLAREADKDPAILDKAVLISNDEEGNGYHGVYFAPTTKPAEVKGILEASNWGDSTPDEYEHAIIIG